MTTAGYDPFDGNHSLWMPYVYWDLTLDLDTDVEPDA